MDRTPPRITRRNNRGGQGNSAQAQGSAQLHPDVDEDSSSPAPQPNTPSPGNTPSTEELLQRILERLENIEKEVRDNKRDADARFQDLNALMIQQTSPRPVKGCGRSRQAFYALNDLFLRQLACKTLAWTGRSPLLPPSHR